MNSNEGYVLFFTVIIIAGLVILLPVLIQVSGTEMIIARQHSRQVEDHYLLLGSSNRAFTIVKKDLKDYLLKEGILTEQKISGDNFSEYNFFLKNPQQSGKIKVNFEVEEIIDEGSKLNINLVDEKRIELLPEIGEVLSKRIKESIKQEGDYNYLVELKKVEGIDIGTYETLKEYAGVVGDEKININTAPVEVLTTLSGVGIVLAERIINRRPFAKIEEIKDVTGIGGQTYNKLKEKIKVTSDWFQVKVKIEVPARNISSQKINFIKVR